jgi:hypothetical protein
VSRGASALLLLAAALGLHLGVARPARERALTLGSEEARLHRDLRALRQRAAAASRAMVRLAAGREQLAQAPRLDPDAAPAAVRAAIVARLGALAVEDVRLEVRPARGQAVATFEVSGRAADTRGALAALASLGDPAEARVATEVRLAPDGAGCRFRVRGVRLQPGERNRR